MALTLGRSIDFFGKSDGRDKFAKTFQNWFKVLAWYVFIYTIYLHLSSFLSFIPLTVMMDNSIQVLSTTWCRGQILQINSV
jgi:hypothetical protein